MNSENGGIIQLVTVTVGVLFLGFVSMILNYFFARRCISKAGCGLGVSLISASVCLWSGLIQPSLAGEGPADDKRVVEADYSQSWQISSYSKESRLSQQRFFDIAFTADGTAWLAADDGLHQFDGYNWSLWGTNHGLPSSFVRAVCVDKADRLWVGSDAGAGVWDWRRQKYQAQGLAGGLANENVREIDQDADGTLWFSCDQWPENTAPPGGLSGFNGRWQTFRQTNGLPMDYVIGYFRDSGGRQFVLTPHGWGQRLGDKWGPPANPGYEAEECVLQMAEARDGTLFAQGENTLLILKNGRWQSHPESHTRLVCATRSGAVAAVEYNPVRGQLWFSLWDGRQFVRASATVACPAGGRLYHLREAPDGSLWCVGIGTVVRWACQGGQWSFYPQLPSPIAADRRGRVWFADESNVVLRADHRFQNLASGQLRVWPGDAQAMIWDKGRNELSLTSPDDPSARTVVESGCETINEAQPDTNGLWWILGQDKDGNGIVTHCQNGKSKIIAAPELAGRLLSGGCLLPSSQLRFIARQRDNGLYGVGQFTEDRFAWLPFAPAPPPITYSTLLVGAGRCWLVGYSGIYEQSLTAPDHWLPVTALPTGGFGRPLAGEREALLIYSGGRSGHAGCALFASNHWSCVDGDFVHPTYGLDKQTIYLASRNGVFIRRQPGTLDFEYLQAPGGVFVNVAVADQAGDIWLGTSDGTFCYHPSRVPPKTVASASTLEIRRGTPLPVSFLGQSRFENVNNPNCFRYSWRVDELAWSPFVAWPGQSLNLPVLAPGEHVLAVRARDVDGNVDPSPALVKFTILAEPLQNQPWFIALVALAVVVLAWLLWSRIKYVRQIATTNSALRQEIGERRKTEAELIKARAELELRVTHRTEQLTRANEQLKLHIAERQKAEEHRRLLEAQLHQAQKLEAIGTLAGGIAHDFNNILAVIIPYCALVMDDLPGRPDLQEQLREVLKAANRAKELVQQILTFSHRQQRQQRQICHAQPAVKEALKLLRSALPSTIQIRQTINPTNPILADPTQIHQVVMNLCVNAQHAMEGRQGLLEVSLDEWPVDEAQCERNADLRPGPYVRLSVRDNGCGISPENLKRIFEPFFTTRDVGKGTGLGLAVVHGIVRDHDGAILVRSELGRGTEFQVLFPAQIAAASKPNSVAPPPPPVHGGHILIVDDEISIVNVLKRLLVRTGYTVTIHADPQAAFKDFISRPTDFDLVLTDLTMPGMNGLELAAKISGIRPELPILIATGFSGDLIGPAQLAHHPNIRKVVEKPLNPDGIIRVVAEMLPPKKQG